MELFADLEVMASIMEDFWGGKSVLRSLPQNVLSWSPGIKKKFLRQTIDWWYRMGYDYVALNGSPVSGLYFTRKERFSSIEDQGEGVYGQILTTNKNVYFLDSFVSTEFHNKFSDIFPRIKECQEKMKNRRVKNDQ